MANMNNLFEILDASDADDLDFARISAQVEEVIEDSCSCSCTCC
jgi:hypothetical protein